MKRPIIGITGNERPNPEDEFAIMSYAAKGFVEGVKEVGGTPIILPIGDADMAQRYIQMIDKLILTGGQNVSPQFYGEEKTIDSDDYYLERDLFELALIHEAIQQQNQFLPFAAVRNCLMLQWVELFIKILSTIGKTVLLNILLKN